MGLDTISLLALLLVIAISCFCSVNVGVLAVAMAWIIGVYIAPQFDVAMNAKSVMAGFPSTLALTLIGVTLFFCLASSNGTLARLTHRAVRLCRGNAALVPLMFYALTALLAAIGAGSIAAAALVAPMAMPAARRAGVPAMLMAVLVGHGAVGGSLSKFALTGVVVNERMDEIGLSGHETETFLYNLAVNSIVALAAYILLGGWKLVMRGPISPEMEEGPNPDAEPLTWRHWLTLLTIVALIAAVLGLKADVGLAAFAASALLIVVRAGDERRAMADVPWGVIVMVSGVSLLVSVVEHTGGLEKCSKIIADYSTAGSVNAVVAFVSGVVSVFSSTSGVVLPAFLPMVPKLASHLGLSDGLGIAMSINIGSGLVDVSPVSTIGALCLASAPPLERDKLFRWLLLWGAVMAPVGAICCWAMF